MVTRVVLASAFAAGALVFPAASAAVAGESPGACNMLNVGRSAVGFDGMLNSGHGQGLENMIELVLASEAAGCEP